jgi:hypothetical protein
MSNDLRNEYNQASPWIEAMTVPIKYKIPNKEITLIMIISPVANSRRLTLGLDILFSFY